METDSFIIKSDVREKEIQITLNAKVLSQDATVGLSFSCEEFLNFIDMLVYVSKQPSGVTVKRDLKDYITV